MRWVPLGYGLLFGQLTERIGTRLGWARSRCFEVSGAAFRGRLVTELLCREPSELRCCRIVIVPIRRTQLGRVVCGVKSVSRFRVGRGHQVRVLWMVDPLHPEVHQESRRPVLAVRQVFCRGLIVLLGRTAESLRPLIGVEKLCEQVSVSSFEWT